MRRKFALLAAGLLLLPAAGGAQETDITAELEAVTAMMENRPEVETLYGQCPADIFRSKASLQTRIFGYDNTNKFNACDADPVSCATACFESLSPNDCFYTARVVQETEFGQDDDAYSKLFAFACAVGSPGGCTNRGASIRNVPRATDPLTALDEAARDDCLFRTFKLACREGDSWGCAMSGQTYEYGEGVGVDTNAALRTYERACGLTTEDFPSCRFAREGIERIKAGQ